MADEGWYFSATKPDRALYERRRTHAPLRRSATNVRDSLRRARSAAERHVHLADALEPGEILVAPSTDPGWTPLFLTAGGLVMEMGGANSHGAVVAREYGIPAVVGVDGATNHLSTGQTITVDGTNGVITVAPAGAVSLHHAEVTTKS